MTKATLIEVVANSAGISKTAAGKAVDALTRGVTQALKAGESITLPGFGSFSVATRAARVGRNPGNGQSIEIPAKRAAKFKAGKDLRDALK